MEFNWSPEDCISCQENKTCDGCIFITGGQYINLRSLVKYTILPELWTIFVRITTISPVSESGFSLSNSSTYLDGCKLPEVSHKNFWDTMMYFLRRMNEQFRLKMQMKRNQIK